MCLPMNDLQLVFVLFTWLCASSQEVNNVEMWSKMSHDLQFRHQGLFLTGACRGWKKTAPMTIITHTDRQANQSCIQSRRLLSERYNQLLYLVVKLYYSIYYISPSHFPFLYCCPNKVLHQLNIISVEVLLYLHISVFAELTISNSCL